MPAVLASWLLIGAFFTRLADADDQLIPQTVGWNGHSFAYMSPILYLLEMSGFEP
jgi:hypothetical protein